jgi:hypothetical protein
MKKLLPVGTLGVAGLLGAGLLAMPGAAGSAAPGGTDAFLKRDEDVSEVVLVADDDGDDTNDRTRSRDTRSRNTGVSRSTRDHTRSNFTRVSRDRDLSRSDKTRDWTRDGGDRTRDHSQNRTNDRSRNDSRR